MTIEKSDDWAVSASLRISKAPLRITMLKNDFYPRNEGEVAMYNFTVETDATLAMEHDATMIFVFPDEYAEELLATQRTLECSSLPPTKACYVVEPREIHFNIFEHALEP